MIAAGIATPSSIETGICQLMIRIAIIATAMKDCLADPDATERTDDITTEELEKLFLALA